MWLSLNNIVSAKYLKQWSKLPESMQKEIIKYKYRFFNNKSIIINYRPKELKILTIKVYYICG